MYVPGLVEDLKEIRATLADALTRFAGMETGRAWDAGMTGTLEPHARAMVITSLEGKIRDLDAWLGGEWTDDETVTLFTFVGNWEAELLVNRRFKSGIHAVPSIEIPKRGGDPSNPTGLVDPVADVPPMPIIMPTTEHEEGPELSD